MVFGNCRSRTLWICSLSVLLLNYNVAITSYIFLLMGDFEEINDHLLAFASVSLIIGMTLGQVIFGIFGDIVGHRRSLSICAVIMFSGGVLSMLPSESHSSRASVVKEFAACRMILGIGAGGMYPLVASIARETLQEEYANSIIAMVFGPIGSIGLLLAPLVILLLHSYLDISNDSEWRIAVSIGAFPALALLSLDAREQETPLRQLLCGPNWISAWRNAMAVFRRDLAATARSRAVRSYALGTCCAWFLFDVYFFSNVLMQAKVLRRLLMYPRMQGLDGDTSFIATLGLISSALFWVGGLASVSLLRRVSALGLQVQGFLLTASAFFAVAFCKAILPISYAAVPVVLYAVTYVFSGLGPAPTTFLVPSQLFPKEIRATWNGLAAAVGKTGSILGVAMVYYLCEVDIVVLMTLFGFVAMLGVMATLLMLKTYIEQMPRLDAQQFAESIDNCTANAVEEEKVSDDFDYQKSINSSGTTTQSRRKVGSEFEPLIGGDKR